MRVELCLPLAFVLTLAAFSSCNKSSQPDVLPDPFEAGGKYYSSLQEAFDAVAGQDEVSTVTLRSDATCGNVIVPETYEDVIILDVQDHTLTVVGPNSINFGKSSSSIVGNGGSIEGLGTEAPVIYSSDNLLSIDGDVSLIALSGGVVIKSVWTDDVPEDWPPYSEDPLCFLEDFTGTVRGNIIVDNQTVAVYSSMGTFSIGQLSLLGKNSSVDVVIEREIPIAIDVLSGEGKHVACLKSGDITVRTGGQAHVHDFKKTLSKAATCYEPATYMLKCSVCDMTYYETDTSDEKLPDGKCDVSQLIHVPAKAATDFEEGNKEYWYCPYCGKCYSDAGGTKEVTDIGSLEIPLKDFYATDEMLNMADDEIGYIPPEGEGTKAGVKLDALKTGVEVLGTISTLTGVNVMTFVDPSSAQFAEVNQKLDMVQSTVTTINSKMDGLFKQVVANRYVSTLSTRYEAIKTVNANIDVAYNAFCSAVKSGGNYKATLASWGEHNPAALGTILKYFTDYCSSNTLLATRSIPDLLQKFAESQYEWEHEAYNLRSQMLFEDLSLGLKAYIMALLYVNLVKKEDKSILDESYRKSYCDAFPQAFGKYKDLFDAERKAMDERVNSVRRCLITGAEVTFNKKVTKVGNIAEYFHSRQGKVDARLPWYNTKYGRSTFTATVLKCKSECGFSNDKQYMNSAQATAIVNWYKAHHPGKYNSIYSIVKDVFEGFPNGKKDYIIGKRSDPYEKSGPTCCEIETDNGNFIFDNYDDTVYIRSVLKADGGLQKCTALQKCSISKRTGDIKYSRINKKYDIGNQWYIVEYASTK